MSRDTDSARARERKTETSGAGTGVSTNTTHINDEPELVHLVATRKEGAALLRLVEGGLAAGATLCSEQLRENAACGPRVKRFLNVNI